jgi:threonine aldolase
MVGRLAEDHANARKLAYGLAEIDGVTIDPERVETNLVFFEVPKDTANEVDALLVEEGVGTHVEGPSLIRMVTHYGVDADDIDFALSATARVMARIA